MPYQPIQGTNTRWRPAAESLADPKMRLSPLKDPRTGEITGYTGYRQDGWSKLGDVMNFAIPAMMGYGALSAAGAVPAIAGGGAPSAAAGSATTMIPGTGIPVVAGVGPATVAPLGGITAGATGAVTGAAANAAKNAATNAASRSVMDRITGALTSDEGIGSLASLLPMLMSRGGGNSGSAANMTASMPQLQQLLDMSTQRAQRTDPLHQMVTRLAEQRMPIRARG